MKNRLLYWTLVIGLASTFTHLAYQPEPIVVSMAEMPKYPSHLAKAEVQPFIAAQVSPSPITDDPRTWPESWNDADKRVKSCSSSGHDKGKTKHGKNGTLEHPTNCYCTNKCIKHGMIPGTNQFSRVHGDPRCKTTCRADTCKCDPPCV